jgi:hypothetical protein
MTMAGFIRGCALCGVAGLLAVVAVGCDSSTTASDKMGGAMMDSKMGDAKMPGDAKMDSSKMGSGAMMDSGKMGADKMNGGKMDDGKMGMTK